MDDRHAFRAIWHDYDGGIYFITICSYQKYQIFGYIEEQMFHPSRLGELVNEHIQLIPEFNGDTKVLNYVVMPNHIHMVLLMKAEEKVVKRGNPEDAAADAINRVPTVHKMGCLKPPKHDVPVDDFHHNSRLAVIIGSFKAGVTRMARSRLVLSVPCWQSRYHEHIIRDRRSYENIMNYIDNNVINWNLDCFNPQ